MGMKPIRLIVMKKRGRMRHDIVVVVVIVGGGRELFPEEKGNRRSATVDKNHPVCLTLLVKFVSKSTTLKK